VFTGDDVQRFDHTRRFLELSGDTWPSFGAGLNVPENRSIFTSTGSGRQIISRQTLCTPQNVLTFEDGTFTKDPVPCIVGTSESFNNYLKLFGRARASGGRFCQSAADLQVALLMLGTQGVACALWSRCMKSNLNCFEYAFIEEIAIFVSF
jgi:hypothetical protein